MNVLNLNAVLKGSSFGSAHVKFHLIFYNYSKAAQFPYISHRMKQNNSSAASIPLQTAWQLYTLVESYWSTVYF